MTDGPFTADQELDTNKLILVFGDQKAGKTSLIGTLPLDYKVHVIDVDGGWGPAKRLFRERGGDPDKQWTRAYPKTFGELHAALWTLPPDKDVYVIDTYTTAMKVFKSQVAPKASKSVPIEPTDWKTTGGKVSGLAIDYLDHFRRQVAQAGSWGIILCQDKMKDAGDNTEKLCPDLVGAAGRDAAGMVDYLLHYERRSEFTKGADGKSKQTWKRLLRTEESPVCMAGDRSGALNAPHEEADLSVIIEKILHP